MRRLNDASNDITHNHHSSGWKGSAANTDSVFATKPVWGAFACTAYTIVACGSAEFAYGFTSMVRPVIYLDNAATSWPKPKRVIDEMARFMAEDGGSPGRAGHRLAVAADRTVRDARVKLARLIHAEDANRIIHCLNGTDALNIALKGALREGDHVVCTQLDHNSVSRPLEAMAARKFITLTRVPIAGDGCVDPDAIRRAITPATRLITTVHASNVTGIIQPVAEISRVACEHDLFFLVDAAQTAGVVDIDVTAMHIDLLAFPCHKSLLGPSGTGALYVGERAVLRPWREGGTGADSIYPTQPEEFPTRLEAGSPNTVGLAGLNAALDGLDPSQTLTHERTLLDRIIRKLGSHDKMRIIIGDAPLSRRIGVLSLVVEGVAPVDAGAILDESFGIAVRPGLHCAPYAHRALGTFPDGTIRVSPGWSTTEAEVDQLIAALREIAE